MNQELAEITAKKLSEILGRQIKHISSVADTDGWFFFSDPPTTDIVCLTPDGRVWVNLAATGSEPQTIKAIHELLSAYALTEKLTT